MNNKIGKIINIILIMFMGLILTSCELRQKAKQNVYEVLIENPEIRNMKIDKKIDSLVYPKDQVRILSEISGTVDFLNVKEQESVRAGEVLLSLNSQEIKRNLEIAQKQYDKSFEELRLIEEQIDQLSNEEERIPESDSGENDTIEVVENIDNINRGDIENRLNMAETNINKYKSELEKYEKSLESATIYSPIDGVITKLEIKKDDKIKSMDGIITISDYSRLEIKARATSKYARKISKGDYIDIYYDSSEEDLKGVVKEIYPDDENKDFYIIKLELNNQENLIKPNMKVGINLSEKKEQVLSISLSSLKKDKDGKYVYIVKGNKAKKTYVKTGVSNKVYIEIISGIDENDKIIFNLDEHKIVEEEVAIKLLDSKKTK